MFVKGNILGKNDSKTVETVNKKGIRVGAEKCGITAGEER